MKLIDRFKRLTLWNRIMVIGSFVSIAGFILAVVILLKPLCQKNSFDEDVVTKIDDIHNIVGDVNQNVRQLQQDVIGLQGGTKTKIEVATGSLIEVRENAIPEEMQFDFQSGRLFYQRHLETEFPALPERFFVQILYIRATPREARAVQLLVQAERSMLCVFWAYKGYGSVTHNRSFKPPRYSFYIAPLLSQSAMKIYFLDEEPFEVPEVEVEEWIR